MGKDYKIKDSGKRRNFKTGSRRDLAVGKGRPELMSPLVDMALSLHFEKGAGKYGDRNWEKGQPLSVYFGSSERHKNKYRMGIWDENHLIAWLWNVYCLVHTKLCIDAGLLPKELDDLPRYVKKRSK